MIKIAYPSTFPKRLRNAEHLNLFENIVLYIQRKGMKPDQLLPLWDDFRQALAKEKKVFRRTALKAETAAIMAAHKKRQQSYAALKFAIKTAGYSESPSAKEAAERLMYVLEKYPDIYNTPLTETSAMLTKITRDMRQQKYALAVALTGTANAVDRLRRDNDAFMYLYATRTNIKEKRKMDGNTTQARVTVDRTFDALAEAINAFYRANEMTRPHDPELQETLSDFILFVNAFFHEHEAIYLRRNSVSIT